MSDQDVFDSNESSTETPVEGKDLFQDQLSSIVNDDGKQKYNDVETALKSLSKSQDYIKKLEEENRSLRESGDKLGSMESLLQKIASSQENVDNQAPAQPARDGLVTKEELSGLLNSALVEQQAQINEQELAKKNKEQMDSNYNAIKNSLVEKYGSTKAASEEFNKVAEEAGMKASALLDLGKTNPGVVLQLFENKKKESSVSSSQGLNTSAILQYNESNKGDGITVDTKNIMTGAGKDKDRLQLMKQIIAQY